MRGNPKLEIRIPKEVRNPKSETPTRRFKRLAAAGVNPLHLSGDEHEPAAVAAARAKAR